MLKLKTKTAFTAPTERGTINTVIRLIVDGLFMDQNNITPQGYYYYYDENGDIITKKINAMKQWDFVNAAESSLPVLESNIHLYDNVIQRLTDFTFYQLGVEESLNFGTTASDWEIDTE